MRDLQQKFSVQQDEIYKSLQKETQITMVTLLLIRAWISFIIKIIYHNKTHYRLKFEQIKNSDS